ncbi:MAG: hypothetical protein O8C55_12495 [Candidatus Methanoperedens sp.]|nr:hypothetical protein [Candidatus Methanoperedens sp.]
MDELKNTPLASTYWSIFSRDFLLSMKYVALSSAPRIAKIYQTMVLELI